jgi:hypothetical protein
MSCRIERKCGAQVKATTAQRVNAAVTKAVNKCTIEDEGDLMNIDIVVHICYQDAETPESIADVAAMIESLNNDYNGNSVNFDKEAILYKGTEPPHSVYKNMLALKGSANIQFTLIQTIYKKLETPLEETDDMDEINEIIKVNLSPTLKPDECLNIWIVDNLSQNLLGYSSFPWESLVKSKLKYDGVVIDKSTFGTNPTCTQYNMNKTITHEVGHWTGLYHTFQQGNIGSLDSKSVFIYNDAKPGTLSMYGVDILQQESCGDCIADTPYQTVPTYGNLFDDGENIVWPFSMEVIKIGNQNIQTKSWHMFMNFMDYSDDKVLFMFTKDQVTKMRLMLKMFRPHTVGYIGKQHKI